MNFIISIYFRTDEDVFVMEDDDVLLNGIIQFWGNISKQPYLCWHYHFPFPYSSSFFLSFFFLCSVLFCSNSFFFLFRLSIHSIASWVFFWFVYSSSLNFLLLLLQMNFIESYIKWKFRFNLHINNFSNSNEFTSSYHPLVYVLLFFF